MKKNQKDENGVKKKSFQAAAGYATCTRETSEPRSTLPGIIIDIFSDDTHVCTQTSKRISIGRKQVVRNRVDPKIRATRGFESLKVFKLGYKFFHFFRLCSHDIPFYRLIHCKTNRKT